MYQTLYRKYRPAKFSEIVGQDVIIRTLKNSIKNNKISHAYLFVGPRGTGKTSTAKLFASAVTCENAIDGDICCDCNSCKISADRECLDIIEIDAASNNGVDEIRNLRDKVLLVPNQLKYKIYIIDEVHMLTISAFNALLKTLEEPPEHIIFILATTDVQKVPETVISRCQVFNFSRMTEQNIIDNLSMVCSKENVEMEYDVLKQISIVVDGGMRDALGMLDKLIVYGDGKISLDDFLKLNGLVTKNSLEELSTCIFEGDFKKVIDLIDQWNSIGKNLIQIIIQYLDYLRDVLVEAYIHDSLEIDRYNYQLLANLINDKMFDIKKSSNPKIFIEIMILNFMSTTVLGNKNVSIISREIIEEDHSIKPIISQEVSHETEQNKEKKFANSKVQKQSVVLDSEISKSKENSISLDKKEESKSSDSFFESKAHGKCSILNSNLKEIMEIRVNNAFVYATKEILKDMQQKFIQLNDYVFNQEYGYLICSLLEGTLRLSSDEYIVISYEYDSVCESTLENLEQMENILKKLLDIDKKLVIISDSFWNEQAKNFVNNKKLNIVYKYIEEPPLVFNKCDEGTSSTSNSTCDSISEMFGDIVEIG